MLSHSPVTTPAPIPLGFTTTRRPFNATPRVKSNLRFNHRNQPTPNPLSRPSPPPDNDQQSFINVPPLIEDKDLVEDVTENSIVNPFDNPPFISADGKKPRVKANLNTKFAHSHGSTSKDKPEKSKKQGSKKVELDRSQFANINFISPTAFPVSQTADVTPFPGPELRPDGRVPRVKSNVLAKERDQGQASAVTSPRPRPHHRPSTFIDDDLDNEIDDGFEPQTQSVSPSTIRNIFPANDMSSRTPRPIFSSTFRNTFNDATTPRVPPRVSTFEPFSADPPRFSILSATPTNVDRLPSTTPTPPPPRFRPPPTPTFRPQPTSSRPKPTPTFRPQPTPSRPLPSNFGNLGPPPQPSIPASLPPPPSQSRNKPLLQRNRNRFGVRPRVKANELAQKANHGNRQHELGESPRTSFSVVTSPTDENEIIPGVIVTQQPKSRPRPSRPKFNVRFKTQNDITNVDPCLNNPFKCPPRKSADGRRPRVKSNIKAARRNFWHPRKGRVIKKQRKQGKLNAALWNRGIIRQGRKQSLSQDKSNAIDNNIDDDPITTQDPIRSLKQIVASKEKHPSKIFKAFPAARSFQNKRLRLKQKINHGGRSSAFQRTTAFSNNIDILPSTTPLSVVEQTTASTTSKLSLFVTNPDFNPRTTPASVSETRFVSPDVSVTNHSPLSVLPVSNPTQSAPQNPFTQPDMGLFVTNPRALPEQSLSNEVDENRNLLNKPPERSPNDRRPRVKSNIMAQLQNTPRGHVSGSRSHVLTTPEDVVEEVTTTTTAQPVLRIVPDGRSPRVKSNLLNKSSNRKHHQKNKKHKFNGSNRRKFGRSLDLNNDVNEIEDASDEEYDVDFDNFVDDNSDKVDDDYTEPEVRPDGRKPRIKSNILAKKSLHRKDKASGKHFNKHQKKGKSGFRHSKKVPHPDTSFRRAPDDTTPFAAPNNLIDGTDNAITTFRPVISLEELMSTNETFPSPSPAPAPPSPAAGHISVPLPNFDKSIISTSAAFEPAFSDMTNSTNRHVTSRAGNRNLSNLTPSQLPQSVTEIVRVSSKDKNLFNSDYSYYDYYEEFINST